MRRDLIKLATHVDATRKRLTDRGSIPLVSTIEIHDRDIVDFYFIDIINYKIIYTADYLNN